MKRTDNDNLIAMEGWPFIFVAMVLFLLVLNWHKLASIPFLLLVFFVVYFFRNPKRVIPAEDNLVVCPADGKVIFVGEVDENRLMNQKLRRVSIFMSPLNVHVNRIPVSGTIKKVSYNKGKFFPAHAEKASLDNEQNAIIIETADKKQIMFVQIAGWLARRIVNYAAVGETWTKGHLFGLIRFGSRVDIYLPLDLEVCVKVGDITKGGETVLAKL